jgi:predicted RNase H-like HicB family nuclease
MRIFDRHVDRSYDAQIMKTYSNKIPPSFSVEFDREVDGRWIAEIRRLPGVMAYGATKQDALRHVRAIALRTLADVIETGRTPASISRLFSHGMASR